LLVGVHKHKHWDHRQDEDHGKEEDDEEVDSKAGPLRKILELGKPVGDLADLEADLRRPLAASDALRGGLVNGGLDLVNDIGEL